MPSILDSMRPQYLKLTHGWNPMLFQGIRRYMKASSLNQRITRRSGNDQNMEPYWLLVPGWLAGMYRKKNRRLPLDRRFLKDVIWAQYCLFLAIKIHDDLFDRHVDRPALLWAGDEFLLESQRVLLGHFAQSPRFWKYYHSAIRTTIQTIQDVDACQIQSRLHYRKVVQLYAAGYAVCKIATYAVCLRANRMNDFQKISVFFDHMAIVGQTIDDFQDMVEDARRERINAAAAFILRSDASSLQGTLEKIAYNFVFTDASQRLFNLLQQHIERAEKSIRSLNLPALLRFVDSYKSSVKRLADHVHTQRVKFIFGKHVTRIWK